MPITKKCVKWTMLCLSLTVLLLLAACSTSGSTDGTGSGGGSVTPPTITQQGTSTGTVVVSTSLPKSNKSTPGIGPIVINSPTVLPGNNGPSQVITLPDRLLLIGHVSTQAGADATSTGVSLTITIKNTSAKAILNQVSYFQLVGTEGDSFGSQSSVSANFYGTILPHLSHSGTIVFQVPTAVISGGLRLLYRSEIATETVFVALTMTP